MTTKRKECFAYSKEVGGDPVACVEGDRTGSDFYIDSAMGYANYVWRARGMCVKEVSVAPPQGRGQKVCWQCLRDCVAVRSQPPLPEERAGVGQMSGSMFMQEFRRGMEHCRVNPLRECAVRSPEPTWEENNGVVKFIQPEKSPPLRLVLLMMAENSYVVMLCDKDWTPAGQAPCSSVQEFSNKRAANLAFEAAARLCSQAGRMVIEQYRMQVQVSRPNEFVTSRFGDEY